ncbi:MAG: acyltransferase [Betaproteobacteria bacterium]|nr:acyltransferase [Betaproteobacteria bacterium]
MRSDIAYRPDIDGLRALAVIAVIGFHAFPELVHGGFTGVDVFFVISGFLISGIILVRLENDNFSFIDFYARRVRRILPALLPILIASLLVGWFALFADEYRQLGRHVAAGAGFVSNFILMQESGYFDNAAETKPLLHLWSLSIEEQFYVAWPLLIALLWLRRSLLPAFILLTLLFSLAVSIAITAIDEVEAYYSPLTRYWELMAGSLLACLLLFAPRHFKHMDQAGSRLGNALSLIGMVLIVVATFSFSKQSPFPGWRALLPVMGTAMLIAAGPGAWMNSVVLSHRSLVWLGLISYPLYLWHWPLLSFLRIIEGQAPAIGLRLAAIVISLVLAWLTYMFIESPIRSGRRRGLTAAFVVLMMIGVGYAGYHIQQQGGFPARIAAQARHILAASGEWGWPGKSLQPLKLNGETYQFQPSSTPKTVLYWGDSYMQHYYPRIDALLSRNPDNYKSALFMASSCPPIPGVSGAAPCRDQANNVLEHARASSEIDTVVISASLYKIFLNDASMYAFKQGSVDEPLGLGRDGSEHAYRSLQDMFLALRKSGKKVFLVLPHPNGTRLDPKGIVRRDLTKLGAYTIDDSGVTRESFGARTRPIRERLVSIAGAAEVTVIDPVAFLCDAIVCPSLTEDGEPMYMDAYHLRPGYVRGNAVFLDVTLER